MFCGADATTFSRRGLAQLDGPDGMPSHLNGLIKP
jgi:hypothetical protein